MKSYLMLFAAAITGRTPEGKHGEGYQPVDEFPMDHGFQENAELFTLNLRDSRGR